MSKKTIAFIINPISGVGKKKIVEQNLKSQMDREKFDYQIFHTQYRGHGYEISKTLAGNVHAVVAVGGDGTVNEVGSGLVQSTTSLGIIPTGSGNGLARYLEIPLKINQAIDALKTAEIRKIDVMAINNYYSLNVAGTGFDAYISQKFAEVKKRGPLQYMRLITKEFAGYQSGNYELNIDGHSINRKAFLISFANSSQWGNNVHIAPGARIDDGLIDVCIVADFPKLEGPALLISLLDQSIDKSKYDEIIRARKIHIRHPESLWMHIDGEPILMGKTIEISVLPLALQVLVPSAEYQNRSVFDPLIEMLPAFPFKKF